MKMTATTSYKKNNPKTGLWNTFKILGSDFDILTEQYIKQ